MARTRDAAQTVLPAPLTKGFRLFAAVLYLGLSVGLDGLHANEKFFPQTSTAWADPAAEHHGGHNHAACLLFWSSVPSPAAPPPSPPLVRVSRQWEEPAPALPSPPAPWLKGPLPRGPPVPA